MAYFIATHSHRAEDYKTVARLAASFRLPQEYSATVVWPMYAAKVKWLEAAIEHHGVLARRFLSSHPFGVRLRRLCLVLGNGSVQHEIDYHGKVTAFVGNFERAMLDGGLPTKAPHVSLVVSGRLFDGAKFEFQGQHTNAGIRMHMFDTSLFDVVLASGAIVPMDQVSEADRKAVADYARFVVRMLKQNVELLGNVSAILAGTFSVNTL